MEGAAIDDTNYSLGSVLNHVCMHQTIIGLEAKKQLEIIDEYPDVVIACCGGGSNFSGMAFPFLMDKFNGKNVRAIAVEPAACPTLTKGVFAFDYGDTAQMAPSQNVYMAMILFPRVYMLEDCGTMGITILSRCAMMGLLRLWRTGKSCF